jgi:integrase
MPRLTDSRVKSIQPPPSGQEEHPDEIVTGLRLRVGAGGRKAWIVRARTGKTVINKTIGAYPIMDLAKARDAARDLLEKIDKRGGEAPVHRTFGDLVDLWMEKVAEPNNSTAALQKRRLEIHVLPAWKDKLLTDIRRADVRDLIDAIEGDVAPNRVLSIVKTIFRYALSRDWIEASPAEAIGKPRDEAPRDRYLDMGEVKRVWLAADLLGYPFGAYIRMLLLTGQRRTEVAEMRWDDIDEEAATWIMSSASTKSDRAHLVPLSPVALGILGHLPKLGDYVFTTDGENPISGFAKAKTRLDTFIKAKGGEMAAWRLHDLRRTVATHMVRLGVTETIVGRVLNHAAQGVTAKVYALHSYAPEKRSALDRWAAEIERAAAGAKAGNVVAING